MDYFSLLIILRLLESIYNIPRCNIRYLHGRRNTNDKLIVGHCNNIDGDSYLPKDPAICEYQAYRSIADVVNDERKNVTDIILKNDDFWQQLSNIDKVVIYGHSFIRCRPTIFQTNCQQYKSCIGMVLFNLLPKCSRANRRDSQGFKYDKLY